MTGGTKGLLGQMGHVTAEGKGGGAFCHLCSSIRAVIVLIFAEVSNFTVHIPCWHSWPIASKKLHIRTLRALLPTNYS